MKRAKFLRSLANLKEAQFLRWGSHFPRESPRQSLLKSTQQMKKFENESNVCL